jgi:hypothetical protein
VGGELGNARRGVGVHPSQPSHQGEGFQIGGGHQSPFALPKPSLETARNNARLRESSRFLKLARPLTAWLGWTGAALILVALRSGSFYAPPERLQGESVRIIYLHVPAAWLGMAGWTGIALASLMQLIWRHPARRRRRPRRRRSGGGLHLPLPRHRLALGPADLGAPIGNGTGG